MGGRGEQAALEVGLPQRAQRIDDQNVGVEIQDPVEVLRQQVRREQAVVHLLRVPLGHRRLLKEVCADRYGVQRAAERAALLFHALQAFRGNAAVHQVKRPDVLRAVDRNRSQEYLQLRQVVFIQRHQQTDGAVFLIRVFQCCSPPVQDGRSRPAAGRGRSRS